MEIHRIDEFDWGLPSVELDILDPVMDELKGLMRDRDNREKAKTAQHAYDYLDAYARKANAEGLSLKNGRVHLFFSRPPSCWISSLDPDKVDHQIIEYARQRVKDVPGQFCAILTLDREMLDLCLCQEPAVQPISPSKERLVTDIPAFLRRRLESAMRQNNGTSALPRVVISQSQAEPGQPGAKKRARVDPVVKLNRLVGNFHSKIIASHHRAILTLAPFQARLALTARLVDTLSHASRRVMLLFVESRPSAEYWAGELRQRCHLPPEDVLVFFDEALEVHKLPRVVIYTFDQIESRFRQHTARLDENQRSMTIVVDGCDLLRPEQAVMLLLNEGQFIGYTRHHLHHSQSRSGRMLSRFFDDQSILRYTFADAEQDGWLHSFELIPQQVRFEDWEETEYKNSKAEYLSALNKAETAYPGLNPRDHFWTSLHELLDVVADPVTARLFVLRESLESQPQIATGKQAVLFELLGDSQVRSIRTVVYDPTQFWIKCLPKKLSERKISFVIADDQTNVEEWQSLLNQMDEKKSFCLITPVIPPYGLNRNHIQRLLITSPICSQVNMAAMVDWILYHSFSTSQTIELHILYVPATYEENALIEFSQAICGLSFEFSTKENVYPI
jgi:hypothetical protein